jgi:hypothetical protein
MGFNDDLMMIYWNLMLLYSNGIRQLWPLNMTQHDPRRPPIVDRGKTLQPFARFVMWSCARMVCSP